MSDEQAPPAAIPLFLTTDEAAAILRWLPDTVRRKAVAGELPALRVGRHWRFEREQLLAYVRGEWKPAESTRRVRLGHPGIEKGAEILKQARLGMLKARRK